MWAIVIFMVLVSVPEHGLVPVAASVIVTEPAAMSEALGE